MPELWRKRTARKTWSCSSCGGRGYFEKHEDGIVTQSSCSTCGGSGQVIQLVSCSTCRGNGTI